MAYNTSASSDKLTCTEYVDFGKCQYRFGQFCWFENDSNYSDVKLKVFTKDDNEEFRPLQNPTMEEADFNQFVRLTNQLVIAEEKNDREENLSPVVTLLSKEIDQQLKLAHKMVGVMDRANRKFCVTLLRYSVDKPGSSYGEVRLFQRKKEDEKFQQIFYVNFKLDEFIYLFDVVISVYNNFFISKPVCNIL